MSKRYPPEIEAQIFDLVTKEKKSRRAVARQFEVSPSFVIKLVKRLTERVDVKSPGDGTSPEVAAPDPSALVVSAVVMSEMLGVSKRSISEFGERGIIKRIARNQYALQQSVKLYCEHLRTVAAGRGGDSSQELNVERARLFREQADNTALKNAELRKELVPAVDVEREWSDVLRKVRAGILAVTSRVRAAAGLTAAQAVELDGELRRVLTELGNDSEYPSRGVASTDPAAQGSSQ